MKDAVDRKRKSKANDKGREEALVGLSEDELVIAKAEAGDVEEEYIGHGGVDGGTSSCPCKRHDNNPTDPRWRL